MTKKVFSLNNTGTEVQTIFGHQDPKDDLIIIDKVESHSFVMANEKKWQDTDFEINEEDRDDTLLAKDLLTQPTESLEDIKLNQFVTSSDTEYAHHVDILTKIFNNLNEKNFDLLLNLPPKYVESILK